MRPRGIRLLRCSRLAIGCVLVALVAAFGVPSAAVPAVSSTPATGLSFTAVDIGSGLGCGRTRDGVLVCWNDHYGWDNTQEIESFSVGWNTVCGITPASELICRGRLESLVPADPGTFEQVGVGLHHLCAVRTTGALACWGDPEWWDGPAAEAGPFSSVSAGRTHTCAVLTSGGVRCWGDDYHGQAPAEVPGEFTAVAVGGWHTCGLLVDGSLRCWGDDRFGQLGRTPSGAGFVAVAATEWGSCAIDEAQHATCWGRIDGTPAPPDELSTLTSGSSSYCGVTPAGGFSCWADGEEVPRAPTGPASTQYSGPAHYPIVVSPFVGNPWPTFAVVSGTPPPGTVVDPDRGITGKPTTPGRYVLTVSATNLFGTVTAEITLTVTQCGPSFDVNADGLPDLAVGTPGKDVSRAKDAGAVTVFFGDGDGGYGALGGGEITQEQIGQRSAAGDRFGAALAVGDVSGDGCPDLVVGAPGEGRRAGQVTVLLASAKSVGAWQRVLLRQGAGAAGRAEAGDQFGAAMSLRGDVLWVGSPGEDAGKAKDAGVVTKIPVNPLTASTSVQYRQGAGGVPGRSESGDRFGSALDGGYLIGAPGEDVGRVKDAGAVTVGLTRTITQNSTNVPGVAEAGDAFGAAVVRKTDVCYGENDGRRHSASVTAIGVPGEDIAGRRDAGAITVLGALRAQVTQGTAKVPGTVERGDRFGAALASMRDWPWEFLVGSPGEDIGKTDGAGSVTVLEIGLGCWEGDGPFPVGIWGGRGWSPGAGGVPGKARAKTAFGATLTTGPFYPTVVGAPGSTVGGRAAGAIWLRSSTGWQVLSQATPGVPGEPRAGDRLGAALPG